MHVCVPRLEWVTFVSVASTLARNTIREMV
jgi:hypothetical protein